MSMHYPKISIVTCSYNQGHFLEETILSVIGQHYPNLEYIIIDGGSTDNSVEIIRKYEKHLAYWVSEKDEGQTAALNKGFSKATGSILGWLNSDDVYLPGALQFAASNLNTEQSELLFGNCFHFTEGTPKARGSDVVGSHKIYDLLLRDYVIQPSSFWTRAAWLETGTLDETFNYSFDWDWFIRAQQAGVAFKPVEKYLSIYRLHDAHKTGTGGGKRLQELALIYRTYCGASYENLFLRFFTQRSTITSAGRWVRRFRLTRFQPQILKFVLPHVFMGFKASEIRRVLCNPMS